MNQESTEANVAPPAACINLKGLSNLEYSRLLVPVGAHETPYLAAAEGSMSPISLYNKSPVGLLLHQPPPPSLHSLCKAASNQQPLSSQKGHIVPLMVF